jgi:hypothetical protein
LKHATALRTATSVSFTAGVGWLFSQQNPGYLMRTQDKAFHRSWHLYGHVHARLEKEDARNTGMLVKDVSVDACDYRPRSFDDLGRYVAPRIERFHQSKAAFLDGKDAATPM